jgi:hypothetical protein
MNLTKEHRYSQYKNQTLSWLDTDSEKTFQANMQDPIRRQQIEKYNWHLPNCITYKFNSLGFRSEEFTGAAGFIALGCSFTSGIGLPIDQIWPSIVSQQTGLQAFNLAQGDGSMDTCFRLLSGYIKELDPKFVMLLRPVSSRFEIHNEAGPHNVLINVPRYSEMQKVWYADEQNQLVNFYKNTLAIQYLCQVNNVKLIIKDSKEDLSIDPSPDAYPAARDLLHNGHASHIYCAERFLKDL